MKKIIILSITLLMSGAFMAQEGEIIYTDFEPDSTMYLDTIEQVKELYLDLDQDGVNEWYYWARPGDWGHYREVIFSANPQVVGHNNPDFEETWIMNVFDPVFPQFGDTLPLCVWYANDIHSQYQWGHGQMYVNGVWAPSSHYFEPHYMGVRKRVGEDEYCYGWVEASVYIHSWQVTEFTVLQSIDVTVYRTAYCTVPNYPLRVGQTDFSWTGLDGQGDAAFATLHPNPTSDIVTVSGQELENAEAFNALGQRIASVKGSGEQLTIDLSGQPAGIYFVNVTDSMGRKCVKKVVKH